jgi:hypothetical protein
LRKNVLLRWSVGAVGAGSAPGGAAGGARFGVLRLGEGRVPSRNYVGRGKVPVAGERGVGVGRRLVGRRRAGHRRAGCQRLGVGVEWVSTKLTFSLGPFLMVSILKSAHTKDAVF